MLSESEVQRCFMNCVFIFIMQMTLTFSCLASILYKEKENEEKKQNTDKVPDVSKNYNDEMAKISFSILVTRYLCAVILHLAIEGEVEQAINMMKFTLYRTGSWNRRIPMFLVAVMQLLGAICTETVNMILICKFT